MSSMTNMNKLHLTLRGTSPLVVNNIRGADPDEPLVKEIKKITDKKSSMTSEDRTRLEQLKWTCSLYEQDAAGNLTFPVAAVLKSFQKAASAFRKGTALQQAVTPTQVMVPIQHNGPRNLEALYADNRFRFRNMVNSNPSGKKAMVPMVRPIFPEWALELDVVLFNDILGEAQFIQCAELAGIGQGVGNARPLGYGRFDIDIKTL